MRPGLKPNGSLWRIRCSRSSCRLLLVLLRGRLPWVRSEARTNGVIARHVRRRPVRLLGGIVVDHERRLIGRHQQPATVCTRVIDELPLIVVVLLVELANGFVLAKAGHAYNA